LLRRLRLPAIDVILLIAIFAVVILSLFVEIGQRITDILDINFRCDGAKLEGMDLDSFDESR
jgi:hypothetical protein